MAFLRTSWNGCVSLLNFPSSSVRVLRRKLTYIRGHNCSLYYLDNGGWQDSNASLLASFCHWSDATKAPLRKSCKRLCAWCAGKYLKCSCRRTLRVSRFLRFYVSLLVKGTWSVSSCSMSHIFWTTLLKFKWCFCLHSIQEALGTTFAEDSWRRYQE